MSWRGWFLLGLGEAVPAAPHADEGLLATLAFFGLETHLPSPPPSARGVPVCLSPNLPSREDTRHVRDLIASVRPCLHISSRSVVPGGEDSNRNFGGAELNP